MKEKDFNSVYNMLRDLEATDAAIIEGIYQYKMNDRIEFEIEEKQVVKEYKMGSLDPDKGITKFQSKQQFKKRKE